MKKINELFKWPNEKPNVPQDAHGWFEVDNANVLDANESVVSPVITSP